MVFLGLILYTRLVFALGNNFNTGLLVSSKSWVNGWNWIRCKFRTNLAPLATKHFPNESRSKAAGFVTAFGGLGMFIFPALSNYLMVETTWQNTFTVFSIILFIMCIPGFFFKKSRK